MDTTLIPLVPANHLVLKRPSQTNTASGQTGIIPIGGLVNDTATVHSPPGLSLTPTGNVTFFLCYLGIYPSSLGCSTGAQVGGAVALSGSTSPAATSESVDGSTTPN